MTTIKQEGLNTLLRQGFFSQIGCNPYDVLTSDLTETEILRSLDVITKTKKQLTEFLEQYPKIKEQLDTKKEEYKNKKYELNSISDSIIFVPTITVIILLFFTIAFYDKVNIIIIIAFILLGIIGIFLYVYHILQDDKIQSNHILEKLDNTLKPEIAKLKQQIDNLSAIYLLKDSKFGISTLKAVLILKNLNKLEHILQKMQIIAADTKITSSGRLLAMENLLYLLKKHEIDKQLLDEQKKSNELTIKSIQEVKRAVKAQMHYQVGQDLGSEAMKASAVYSISDDDDD